MKFSTTFFTLFMAATVLSKKEDRMDWTQFKKCLNEEGEMEKEAQLCEEVILRGEENLNQCINDVLEDCEPNYAILDFEKDCKAWEKSKCKHLSSDNLKIDTYSSCKGIPEEYFNGESEEVVFNIKSIIDMTVASKNLKCSKDEHGHFCPYVLAFASEEPLGGEDEEEKKLLDAINATCLSKSCTDAYVYGQTMIENYLSSNALAKRELVFGTELGETEKMEKIMSYLTSEECISQHGSTTSEEDEEENDDKKEKDDDKRDKEEEEEEKENDDKKGKDNDKEDKEEEEEEKENDDKKEKDDNKGDKEEEEEEEEEENDDKKEKDDNKGDKEEDDKNENDREDKEDDDREDEASEDKEDDDRETKERDDKDNKEKEDKDENKKEHKSKFTGQRKVRKCVVRKN